MKPITIKNILLFSFIILAILISIYLYLNIGGVKETKLNTVINNIVKDKTFTLYLGSDNCSECDLVYSKLLTISEEKRITVYYLNTSKLTYNETEKLAQYIKYNKSPTIIFIKKGEELTTSNRIEGNQSKEVIINKLKINKIIK